MSPVNSADNIDTDVYDSSLAHLTITAPLASQTDITSPSLSLRRSQPGDDIAVFNFKPSYCNPMNPDTTTFGPHGSPIYRGALKQDDVVGQFIVRRAAFAKVTDGFQAPESNYVNESAGYFFQGVPYRVPNDSHASLQMYQRWYPDPESIRHCHTLHSLLPHIQPERKLNALNGLELNIVEGHTGKILCHAVPKKMLVLFLGREVVSKFLHTTQREHNESWSGPPTQQIMILPSHVASAVALRIIVSWMQRACQFATMYAMKQIRIPANLFAACSLAQTLNVLGLHRDADRIDCAITQQAMRRPLYAVEIETLWRCLGASSKYVYGCIKAVSSQPRTLMMDEEFKELAERCPELYARICEPALNAKYKPHFGREWFKKPEERNVEHIRDRSDGNVVSVVSKPNTEHEVAQTGGYYTADICQRSVRSLDPSAADFKPSGERT